MQHNIARPPATGGAWNSHPPPSHLSAAASSSPSLSSSQCGALGSLAQRTIKGRRNYDSQTCPDARGWPDGSDAGLENRVGKKPIASLTQVDGLRSVMSQKVSGSKVPETWSLSAPEYQVLGPRHPTFRHPLSTYRQRAM
ncbi:hypothetical protein CDV36_015813 [Fusarium kuroshium]|uniref:Uncharacterized protein n=2 Tax=Fusarium solani species complex TaxID=232080 RepID=A0A3M2R823_9HYPO|nr:hypothetical protein CDV36_015813 [Fusarium kuroshium]RSL48220.1 hypothetical protein CEP51_015666 [Fusarium floridanum]